MLYFTRIDVSLPDSLDDAALAALRAREKARADTLQSEGVLLHLWRVAGQAASLAVWNCKGHDELHEVLTSMPMFKYFRCEIIPLARHPSAQ